MTYQKLNNVTISNILARVIDGFCSDCSFDPIVCSAVEVEAYHYLKPSNFPGTYLEPTKITEASGYLGDLYAREEPTGFRIYVSEKRWTMALINAHMRAAHNLLDKLR